MDKSQYKNIMIDRADSLTRFGPCEGSIYINPKNTKNMIVGSVLNNVYRSIDGGFSWKKDVLKSDYGVYGDPVIHCDYFNNFYYVHLSDPSGEGWRKKSILDRIVIQKSVNGGLDWNNGTYAGLNSPKDQDKPWLSSDPRTGELYLTWTEFDLYESKDPNHESRIMFSKSLDFAESWSKAKAISNIAGNSEDDDLSTVGAVPVAGINGEVFVSWSYDEKIYFDRSMDGGKSWLENDIVVAEQKMGWNIQVPGLMRANGLPAIAVDHSKSVYRGRIYINWTDQRNGDDDTDVWLIKSDDNGLSWSDPVRVNDDKGSSQQFFSAFSVDPLNGYIYVVFYDRRNHDDNKTDVYLAHSMDGGKSFKNEIISEKPFTANKNIFFGDYNSISSYGGVVRPVWTRVDGDILSLWTAMIEVK